MNIRSVVRIAGMLIVLLTPIVAHTQTTTPAATAKALASFSNDLAELQALAKELDASVAPLKTAPARERPSAGSRELFSLPPGEPVEILRDEQGWIQARTKDGRVGWAQVAFFPTIQSREGLLESILKKAKEFKDKYSAGPIVVTGFTLGLPATLSVDFEFK